MPCEHYQDALIEAAASGTEPQGELRSHLSACPACYAVLAEEQSLFSSIDTGLQVTANAEVPASLLPRVRARITEEATSKRGWTQSWLTLAGAAAMVFVFFALYASRHANVEQMPVETATRATPPSPAMSPSQNKDSVTMSPRRGNSVSQPRAVIAKNFTPPQTLVTRNPETEVLVPRDQEVLLARYAENWRGRKRPPLLAETSSETPLEPLQIAPIQISQLDVKLMTEEQGQ